MADPPGALPAGPYGPAGNQSLPTGGSVPQSSSVPGGSFADLLKQSVNDVNTLQHNASQSIEKLVTGEISSIHEVMIATEEASIAFNLLLQVRNQLLRTWNELKRMPV
ncbi:MAG: flagellar hook-basal body complex protein FliE [bacterium]|jgi:flagellar hook-basal body complex protein FliE